MKWSDIIAQGFSPGLAYIRIRPESGGKRWPSGRVAYQLDIPRQSGAIFRARRLMIPNQWVRTWTESYTPIGAESADYRDANRLFTGVASRILD